MEGFSNQAIYIPVESIKMSMEFDDFEKMHIFKIYFPLNNADLVIKRYLINFISNI